LFGITHSFAQSKLNYQKVNELSLIYYYASEWDSLINIGISAEKEDIDYYYLNYRIAVAYFFKENFYRSTYFFEKAYRQNALALKDDYFRLIYYKSLLFSKQNNKIFGISNLNDTIFDIYEAPYRGEVDVFYLNGNATALINQEELRFSENNVYSETYYQQSINMFGLGTDFFVNKNLKFDLRYSNARLGMIAAIENLDYFYIRSFTIQQNSFNIKPTVFIGNNHQIDIYTNISFLKGDIFAPVDSTKKEIKFISTKNSSFSGGFAYSYLYKNFSFGINTVFSNYSSEQNVQFGVSLIWYPKGNLDLYTFTEASAFNNNNKPRFIFHQKIGLALLDKLWLELGGFYGDVHNYINISSNYSFEIANHTYGIAGAKLIYTLNPKFSLFIDNQYWWRYTDRKQIEFDNSEKTDIINYQQYNLIGGIKWNF
jgi:hypothetical protein